MDERIAALREAYRSAGQDHVFRFWDALSEEDRADLADQLADIDLDLVARLKQAVGTPPSFRPPGKLSPAPHVPLANTQTDTVAGRTAIALGEQALRNGEVAVVTVAGGQGTRLGFHKPKGLFPIGPVSHKTLFEVHADTVRAIGERYGVRVPWGIMLSDATDAATRAYVQEQNFFGLPPEDVLLFKQASLPALDADGRLILSDAHTVFRSPNGHGGTLYALRESGVLDTLADRGVRHIFYFQVDNPAVDVASPAFLGHHVAAESEMSFKVMRRRDPEEKVGVLVQTDDGRMHVVEYSDLDEELKYATAPDGDLLYPMGSPAIHILDVDFVRRAATDPDGLPLHVAHKRIPMADERGESVTPDRSNGCKFEMFIFDALARARNAVMVEMDRAEEFAPVKNAEGEDSADTCRRILTEKYARWLEAAGVNVPRDGHGLCTHAIEINPRLALDAEALRANLPAGLSATDGDVYLAPPAQHTMGH